MNNYERALESVADAIIKQAERADGPESLLMLAQAAAAIVAADKMASGNLVKPTTDKSNNGWFGKDKK